MDLEDLEFSFEAEDDHDAIRRAMEILAALTGDWPEAEPIEPDGELIWLKARASLKSPVRQ